MKTKTRKLIAAITATALLGSAVGVSAYAFSKTENNNFGFKGTYSLNAFAEETTKAEKTTITVEGGTNTLDASTTMTLTSLDNKYELNITVIDLDDITTDTVVIGYTYNGLEYNGLGADLSNIYYSSVTIKGEGETSTTLKTTEVSIDGITNPAFVVAEVSKVENATAQVAIKKVNTYAFSADTLTADTYNSAFDWTADSAKVIVLATSIDGKTVKVASSGGTYNNVTYKKCIQLGGQGSTEYRSIKVELSKPATLSVIGMSTGSDRTLQVLNANGDVNCELFTTGTALKEGTANLSAGTYYISSKSGGMNVCALTINTYGTVYTRNFTKVAAGGTVCGGSNVEYYIGEDGNNYLLKNGEYISATHEEIFTEGTGEHTYSDYTVTVAPTADTDGTIHLTCDVCGKTNDPTLPILNDTNYIVGEETTVGCVTTKSYVYTSQIDGLTKEVVINVETNTHEYGAWVITTTPTATEKGVATHTCSTCGESESVEIAELDDVNVWTANVTKEPTCTEAGTADYTSEVYGTVNGVELPATGHTDSDGDGVCDNCGNSMAITFDFTNSTSAIYNSTAANIIELGENINYIVHTDGKTTGTLTYNTTYGGLELNGASNTKKLVEIKGLKVGQKVTIRCSSGSNRTLTSVYSNTTKDINKSSNTKINELVFDITESDISSGAVRFQGSGTYIILSITIA